ncbi:hypothetical protein [Alloprevotella tannerae]|uniref:Uncharacterized protein n=1 Tax=Alloprevotella tannerae ATCC 51259 TaxID=626522 RepID=C9LKA2_9BACT|nr:hypothetical protein [Alloprevotella tannerae]EEX70624.1 hypothetical protein GCWU000325_02667 [Alloprevotella tannerae ATCC 51259]
MTQIYCENSTFESLNLIFFSMKVIPSPYSFARHRKLVFTVHNALRRTSESASKTDADNQAVYGVSMGFVSNCISEIIEVPKLSPKKRKTFL